MIELANDWLTIRFPDVHKDAEMSICFQRTLRIPDDNRSYSLPPGLGTFPLARVDDFKHSVPHHWLEHGGIFLPMYQAEAMWVNFSSNYPMAVKIAAGKVNAVSGAPWESGLSPRQDYMVIPDQPWLDGFCVSKGQIRQFVAMPLGEGYTAEEQLTGEAQHGGLQLVVYPMKAEYYEKAGGPKQSRFIVMDLLTTKNIDEMGVAPGGLMRQEIYEDRFGQDAWDQSAGSRCFVHILNSHQYRAVTGSETPTEPVTAAAYTKAGLPWFEFYDEALKALPGASKLAGMDSVAAKKLKKGDGCLSGNDPVSPANVKVLTPCPCVVREGQF